MNAALIDVGTLDRQTYLGGGDIAGVLGLSPWTSRLGVFQKKTEVQEDRPSSGKKKLFSRGKVWEKVVGEMLVAELEAREHTVEVLSTNHRYLDPAVPYFAAEIDYEIRLDDIPGIVNVELKTVHPNASREWGESDTDECPVHYAAQAMWGLGITGRTCCLVAPLFGADEIRVYPIVRDEATIEGMRKMAREFWEQHVIARVAPEPVDLRDVDRLFKREADRGVVADEWAVERLMRYRACDAEIEARALERDVLEFQLKRYMGAANTLTLHGSDTPAITWKSRPNAHLDQERLKAEYPKLHAQFLKRGTSRVFQVKTTAASKAVNTIGNV
jgi:predicted phage-related endonuclease